ncbi:MAG: FAD-dependent oxidoreductase, partial [Pseudomonadota bacterium]
IIRHCRATNITQAQNGEWVVETEKGTNTCEHVVNAGGTYARQMGEWSGLQLPMTSMTHHYFVTDEVPEFRDLDTELPVIRDDRKVSGYIRMEQKKGLIGIYEKENQNSVWHDHCPWEYENWLFEADYDRVMPYLEESLNRMPIFAELGIQREVHGAISHPPDGNPLIGPAPGVRNYWCCCGTQIGIGWGPGLTRELARWMVHGAPDLNMREFDPRRFGAYATPAWQIEKAREDYCLRHEIPFPHFNRLAGRPVKPSALYDRLKAKGAVFEEVYGHERPRWFAPAGTEPVDIYGFRRTALHDIIGAECRAVREGAGIMDISAFTKVEVSGPDAAAMLDRLVANRLPGRVGGIALTHMLDRRGRIVLETTVVRTGEDRFYLVCAAFFEQRLLDHLDAARDAEDVQITCLSDDWAALALNGPRARDVLAACTSADLSNAGFRWLSAQTIAVAGHDVLAMRISYAGELGWEFHMPRAAALDVYDALWSAGQACDIADYGSFAMNALRMEKAFPGAGELTNEVTLPEAAVMRFVKLDKDFVGHAPTQASVAALESGAAPWLCAYLDIEPDGDADGQGGEAVLLNGEVVGSTASMAYGHTVGRVLAFAYLRPDAAVPGTALEVVIMGKPRAARVLSEAIYDPQSMLPRTDSMEVAAQ